MAIVPVILNIFITYCIRGKKGKKTHAIYICYSTLVVNTLTYSALFGFFKYDEFVKNDTYIKCILCLFVLISIIISIGYICIFVKVYKSNGPFRIHYCISTIMIIVGIYAVIYGICAYMIEQSFAGLIFTNPFAYLVDCLYFSVVTFTTVGYGEILPITSLAKIIVMSEILLAFITLTLIVNLIVKNKD